MSEIGNPVVMAAISTGILSMLALVLNAVIARRRERLERQRREFAKAFAACIAYEEFVYVVRRRRSTASEDERVRISSQLSLVQQELAYYSAWLVTESSRVSLAFESLLRKLREVVGTKIHDAWLSPPIEADREMNFCEAGLGDLDDYKKAYLQEVSAHLSIVPHHFRDLVRLLSRASQTRSRGSRSSATPAPG